MKLAIVSFTRKGALLGEKIGKGLPDAEIYTICRLSQETGQKPVDRLRDWTALQFAEKDGLIFISATGIAVRAIAPFVKDKLTDPAVVSVDEAGRFAVPLLSGHMGGANDLARQVATLSGGTAVISTATDVNGCFAVDVWARENGLTLTDREGAKRISAAILEGKTVSFATEIPMERPAALTGGKSGGLGVFVTVHTNLRPFSRTLCLYPKALVLGIGCKKGLNVGQVEKVVRRVLQEHGLATEAVAKIASIDLKTEDAGIQRLAKQWQIELCFYTAEELRAVEGNFTQSSFVRSVTGVDNVCERSAVLASGGGRLLVRKQAGEGVTVAVALLMHNDPAPAKQMGWKNVPHGTL